jgi:uncharacterized repeat protein (TIGR02059 family)
MKKYLIITLLLAGINTFGQTVLNIEGQTYSNTNTNWMGIEIPRTERTFLRFINNSITSVNIFGYLLQAGDEAPTPYNNNLDGAVITGNKFRWNGSNMPNIITHGLFTGYNRNVLVKYNYLDRVPYGIIFKSGSNDGNNMTFDSGGCAYNIVKDGKFSVRIKGINGVNVYNNTFYSGDGQIWYFILVTSNSDAGRVPAPSTGTKIYNNVFYSTRSIPMIKIESSSLSNFECDYNVYWCTANGGPPRFSIDDTELTWEQWRARGYDAHSIVYNPDFLDFESFIPARMEIARDLGRQWNEGLATTAQWVAGNSPGIAVQTGPWQAGAVLYAEPSRFPVLMGGMIDLEKAQIIELVYNSNLENIIPVAGAFTVLVNSVPRTIRSVTVSGNRVILTLHSIISPTDDVKVSYTRPDSNKLRNTTGAVASSFTSFGIVPGGDGTFVDSDQVLVYPNPASNFINLLIQHPTLKDQRIRIYDFAGKLHLEKKLEPGRDFFTIPLNLESGVYLTHIIVGDKKTTKKIVVIR